MKRTCNKVAFAVVLAQWPQLVSSWFAYPFACHTCVSSLSPSRPASKYRRAPAHNFLHTVHFLQFVPCKRSCASMSCNGYRHWVDESRRTLSPGRPLKDSFFRDVSFSKTNPKTRVVHKKIANSTPLSTTDLEVLPAFVTPTCHGPSLCENQDLIGTIEFGVCSTHLFQYHQAISHRSQSYLIIYEFGLTTTHTTTARTLAKKWSELRTTLFADSFQWNNNWLKIPTFQRLPWLYDLTPILTTTLIEKNNIRK